jgi:hypothetical protein
MSLKCFFEAFSSEARAKANAGLAPAYAFVKPDVELHGGLYKLNSVDP